MVRERQMPLGNKNVVGKAVTALRRQHKMKQKDLAVQMQTRGIDIDPASLSKLEGQTRSANDMELWAIADIFGITVDELYPSHWE